MADMVIVRALRDNFTEEEIRTAYRAAFVSYQNRSTEVTITAASFADGNSSGQIAGDPKELMEACQIAIDQIEAAASTDIVPTGPYHVDFSRQYTRT
jgi:hypothetical protein